MNNISDLVNSCIRNSSLHTHSRLLLRCVALSGLFACLATVGCDGIFSEPIGSHSSGEQSPVFSLEDTQGNTVRIEDFRGKVVFLNFWASWCAPCVSEMPAIERVHQIFKDRGLVVIGINGDAERSREEVNRFIESYGLTFRILFDPAFNTARKFGVSGLPETFFIDREGRLRTIFDPKVNRDQLKVISNRPWDSPEYLKEIEKLL